MDDVETASIRQALNQFHGNVSAAARALGISRNTIYRKLPGLASQSKLPDAGRR
jgi:transcriptional regulator of acetoin/glycerol metabolism